MNHLFDKFYCFVLYLAYFLREHLQNKAYSGEVISPKTWKSVSIFALQVPSSQSFWMGFRINAWNKVCG